MPGVSPGSATTFFILLLILYVFGIGWAWKERKLGYVIVLVMSPIVFLRYLFHAYSLFGQASLEGVAAAYTSEAVGAFFVFALPGLGPDEPDGPHPLPLRLSSTQAGIGGPYPVLSSIAGVTYPRLLGILALCLDYIVG